MVAKVPSPNDSPEGSRGELIATSEECHGVRDCQNSNYQAQAKVNSKRVSLSVKRELSFAQTGAPLITQDSLYKTPKPWQQEESVSNSECTITALYDQVGSLGKVQQVPTLFQPSRDYLLRGRHPFCCIFQLPL